MLRILQRMEHFWSVNLNGADIFRHTQRPGTGDCHSFYKFLPFVSSSGALAEM